VFFEFHIDIVPPHSSMITKIIKMKEETKEGTKEGKRSNGLKENPSVDHFYLNKCREVALQSDDPNTQVGCVFVDSTSKKILAKGTNTLVAGCTKTKARVTRPTKYNWIEHAERNAIYSAAKNGVSLEGTTIYVTMFPCIDCARAIIQCGASGLVAQSRPNLQLPRWGEQFQITLEMFDDVGFCYNFADEAGIPLEEQTISSSTTPIKTTVNSAPSPSSSPSSLNDTNSSNIGMITTSSTVTKQQKGHPSVYCKSSEL